MKSEIEVMAERKLLRTRRLRGTILKLIRDNHLSQSPRMDDFEIWSILLKTFNGVGREMVWTLLQDLAVLDYIEYHHTQNEMTGLPTFGQIQLTAAGLRLMSAGQSNEDVELR